MKVIIISLTIILVAVWGFIYFKPDSTISVLDTVSQNISKTSPSPTPNLRSLPDSKILDNNNYHIFQSFNNCGPASLSMALSFYGISKTQQELGEQLRPYQIASGDNDDKSVTLEELAEKSKEFGFIPYHRPGGSPEIIKQFINNDMPVITRTWLKVDDDIGHYRVIKGFDEIQKQFIQDDSFQGKNLRYSYEDFNKIWQKFNYEYLVLVPKDKDQLAQAILGDEVDPKVSWKRAVDNAKTQLEQNPNDIDARFNLSVALYNTGNYEQSVKEFEQVENKLPFRTLWYQIEPIRAYYQLGNYQRVISLTDKILNNHNRAYSEAYILRGQVYLKQNQPQLAKAEFDKALFYNKYIKVPEVF